MPKRKPFDIHILVDGKRIDPKGSIEVCVTSDRLNWATLNVRFTEEGIIADLIENGEVVKSFSNMYDEFEEMMR